MKQQANNQEPVTGHIDSVICIQRRRQEARAKSKSTAHLAVSRGTSHVTTKQRKYRWNRTGSDVPCIYSHAG